MAKIIVDCPYNKGVGCAETPGPFVCGKCGWNPKVEAARKEQIQIAIESIVPEYEAPEKWLLGAGAFPE